MIGNEELFRENMHIVQDKLRSEPKNYVFKLLRDAVMLEHEGCPHSALHIYNRCQHDEFAQLRITALPPFRPLLKIFTPLNTRLTNEEEAVFKCVLRLLKRPHSLTQEKLAKELGFSKESITDIIESLQFKGYLYRPSKEYKYLETLKELDGSPKVARTLLFSFQLRQLTTQATVPPKDISVSEQTKTKRKLAFL